MARKKTLVFLHGIGTGDLDDDWRTAAEASLRQVGYPGLDGVELIAPKYPKTLFAYPDDDEHRIPPILQRPLRGEAGERTRRDLERRTAQLEAMLGRVDSGAGFVPAQALVSLGAKVKKQAARYLDNESDSRARVLRRVLDQIPPEGDIVLVGHSLGSVIAIDLVPRLPRTVNVRGLITLGSPAGHWKFMGGSDRLVLRKPANTVGWWVNFWSMGDPITSGRGISHHFPWSLDRRVPFHGHAAVLYFQDKEVARAIGWAVHGSLSKEMVRASTSVERALDPAELSQLLQLAYAHCVRDNLEGRAKERFQGALALTHAERALRIQEAYEATKMPMPTLIAEVVDAGKDFAEAPTRPRLPPNSDEVRCLHDVAWSAPDQPRRTVRS